MNKAISTVVLTCGLLLLDFPEAAAHDQRHKSHRAPVTVYSDYYRGSRHGYHKHNRHGYHRDSYYRDHYPRAHKRAKRMPHWLRHDRGFRHWYERTRLRRDRYLAWHVLFDIYRWEYRGRYHRRH